ncbi:hypothetical protein SOVF_049280, partial [Spinacia oleracea]
MFTLTSAIPTLRPPPCTNTTSSCNNPPSSLEYAFLYATLAISMVGFGGTRFVIGALGADQFKTPEQQRVFFNWFIFAIEASSVIGFTAVIYLQDKGKWTLSFGLSAAVNAVAIALFLFGSRFYRLVVPQGSPFISIARVLVASFRKGDRVAGEKVGDDYFYGTSKLKMLHGSPTSSLREGSKMESNEDIKQQQINNGKGGWLSSMLILGTSLGLGIASGAWYSNLIVFLISMFNVKNIPAAQINNIFSALINLFPFIAAIFADSAFGSFSITLISSIVSLLGVLMFTLIVTIKSLRPPKCDLNSTCVPPTTSQYSFLYTSLTLASLGLGGTRYILATMGADQLDKPKHQASFFN